MRGRGGVAFLTERRLDIKISLRIKLRSLGRVMLGGKTLDLGLPLCLLSEQLLFGRERGSCFVWVPKPKGEYRSVGAKRGRSFLKGLRPFLAWQGDPREQGDGGD